MEGTGDRETAMDSKNVLQQTWAQPPWLWQCLFGSDPATPLSRYQCTDVPPQYHSFYVFLLDEFWRSDRIRSIAEWVRFFRPPDFIFAVWACLCEQPEHTEDIVPVRAQELKSFRKSPLESYSYSDHANYIKNELGGYGLYYRSLMAALRLIYPGRVSFLYLVDTPTEYDNKVAAAFRRAVQEMRYYQEHFVDDIPRALKS